jgi:hypothetical protein
MPSLADSQAAFAAALGAPGRPVPDDIRRPEPGALQTRRFDVYRNNVTVAAIDALRDIYPAVQTLVGEEFFRASARVYVEQAKPTSPVMHLYGADFGAFLEGFPPARTVPYLGDVARLEFARLQAYHAADAEPLGIAHLAAVPADRVDQVVLTMHPSLALIRSPYPVASLWGASSGLITSDTVDMNCGEDALVIRPGFEVETRALPAGGGAFLSAVMAGYNLGEAAMQAVAACSDFELHQHLAGLFETGCFAGLRATDGGPEIGQAI